MQTNSSFSCSQNQAAFLEKTQVVCIADTVTSKLYVNGAPATKFVFVVTMLIARYRFAVAPGAMGLNSTSPAKLNWMLLGTTTLDAVKVTLMGTVPVFFTTNSVVAGIPPTLSSGP